MVARRILSLAALAVSTIPTGVNGIGTLTDIGSVRGPGSTTLTSDLGNFDCREGTCSGTVTGTGLDIWARNDDFHFLHFNQTGDVTVTVHIIDWTGTHNWRKAGLMLRNNLGRGSANTMIQATGYGVAHQTRATEGAYATSHHHGYDKTGVWQRLVKQGNTVTAYIARDGDFDFMQYNSVEVELGEDYYVGIALAQNRNEANTVTISDFEISDEAVSPASEPIEIGDTGSPVWVQQVDEGLWSVKAGGGATIGGTADSFGFFDQEHTGDIVASLYLDKLTRHNNDSKGGLMIRASHDADSPHVSLLVTAMDGLTMFVRATKGGETTTKNVGVFAEDMDLRLEKTGNSIKCMYKQPAATEWYVLGTEDVGFITEVEGGTGNYYVGRALGSGESGRHATLTTGALVVTAATSPE